MRVRAATGADAAAIARVHVQCWRETYRGHMTDAFLDALDPQAWAERRRERLAEAGTATLVAEVEGELVGFACGGPARACPSAFDAELYALYVLRAQQRRGAGLALVRRLAADLRALGHRALALWVLRDNAGARAFYERLGGTVAGEKTVEVGGASLAHTAYGWPALAALAQGPPG